MIEFSPHTDLEDANKKSFYQIQEAFLYFKVTPNIGDDEYSNKNNKHLESAVLKIWIFQIIDDQVN